MSLECLSLIQKRLYQVVKDNQLVVEHPKELRKLLREDFGQASFLYAHVLKHSLQTSLFPIQGLSEKVLQIAQVLMLKKEDMHSLKEYPN